MTRRLAVENQIALTPGKLHKQTITNMQALMTRPMPGEQEAQETSEAEAAESYN